MHYQLNQEQLKFWEANGFIKITDFLTESQKKNLKQWSQEVESLPEIPGKWMKYFETNNQGERVLCRVENFIDYHLNFKLLANSKKAIDLLSQLMGEKAVLFKEKINCKSPGSNGFAPHQDAPAFISFGQTYHITMMLAIDDATIENGCLELIEKHPFYKHTLPQNTDGSITEDYTSQFQWQPVECSSGDVILFDSYIPHYSKSNQSNQSRRAAFITYSKLSEGESKREAYFKDKREKFPPDCERDPDKDYSEGAMVYNVANPIKIKADAN
ncbi:phytanoyl-CoA dioxygenase family protein [Thiotrichales bacterium 19S11-10]|nr:phytanoyl-CoA dioxygenase family protein [Thiotrichales bacterium 19S11-10]MCF6807125.1 phytanoyl-CoA dioxygenase family protein [Thiotrichales bacterium 19S9-11]MCF6811094.1 phytanoyl-CoA dioxygenase family protein [Thiotrichales bacterium 19S9-12]